MDLSNIYNIQKNYFLRGNTLSVSFRKQQLKKLYEAINRYEDAIVDALKKDLGKSREESYMSEIGMVKSEISHMLKHVSSYAKRHYVPSPLAQFVSELYKSCSLWRDIDHVTLELSISFNIRSIGMCHCVWRYGSFEAISCFSIYKSGDEKNHF